MQTVDVAVVQNFLIALLIGALVGVEREKSKLSGHTVAFGGLRTFILFAEAGAVSAWLAQHMQSPWIFIVTLVAIAIAVVAGYVLESRARPDSLGLTTEIAALVVFLLGGVVMYGYAALAVALAILTSAVLAFKQPLHGLVGRLGTDDLYTGLKLAIATFIVLPLLPDRTLDPWGALNPYKLWLLVILISALSLVGYVAVRVLGGARGTAVTGIAGGLVSSTAVSLSFARQSQAGRDGRAADLLAVGILLAWMTMFVRMLLTVAIVYAALVERLSIPLAAMAAVASLLAGYFYRRGMGGRRAARPEAEVAVKNPFSLAAATRFGLLFAVVLLVVKLTERHLTAEGLYVVAGLAGLTDVDAITLSMAEYARGSRDLGTAAVAIMVAALANTVAKCGLVAVVGSGALRARLLVATSILLATGLAGLWLV